MSDIPKARDLLETMAERLKDDGLPQHAAEIERIIPLLWRTSHKPRKAHVHSARSTPELRQQIRDYVAANPNVPSQMVAIHFGVNLGRVSEALAGK